MTELALSLLTLTGLTAGFALPAMSHAADVQPQSIQTNRRVDKRSASTSLGIFGGCAHGLSTLQVSINA